MQAASEDIYIYPRGIRDVLLYTKRKYNNPLIYITENGKPLIKSSYFETTSYTEYMAEIISLDFIWIVL